MCNFIFKKSQRADLVNSFIDNEIHTNEKSKCHTEMSWRPGHVVGWAGHGGAKQGIVYKSPRVCPTGSVLLVTI